MSQRITAPLYSNFTPKNLDDDDLSPAPGFVAYLEAEDLKFLAELEAKAKNKIERINRFIMANPMCPLKDLVKKFSLDWGYKCTLPNGLVRVAFYTDDSHRHEVFALTFGPVNDWIRA